jgi:hypothetical protein
MSLEMFLLLLLGAVIVAFLLAPPLYGIIKAFIRLEIKWFIFFDNLADKLIKKERDEE